MKSTSLILENTRQSSHTAKNQQNAAMLAFPVGPFRMLARYQWGNNRQFVTVGDPFWRYNSPRDLSMTASYFANPKN